MFKYRLRSFDTTKTKLFINLINLFRSVTLYQCFANMSYRLWSVVFIVLVVSWQLLVGLQIPSNESIMDFYALKGTTLEGKEVDFAQFRGKKVLLVNTATECGFTPQLEALEKLHDQYKEDLVVIGIPTNDFGGQEPREGEEIATFCERNYGVSFLMLHKATTKGPEKDPLFRWLTEKSLNGRKSSRIWWNFQKYLVDEEGKLVDYYFSFTKPDSPRILSKLGK